VLVSRTGQLMCDFKTKFSGVGWSGCWIFGSFTEHLQLIGRCSNFFLSIMITSLYEINLFMPNNIYKPMFLSNSSRPNTWPQKFERLGLADTLKRISHYRFDQLENTKGGLAVRLYPVS
jgi:hypothetical protein